MRHKVQRRQRMEEKKIKASGMSLKVRISIAFFCILLIPGILIMVTLLVLSRWKSASLNKEYGIEGVGDTQLYNLTLLVSRKMERELTNLEATEDASFEDLTFLEQKNLELQKNNLFFIVKKEGKVLFCGRKDLPLSFMQEESQGPASEPSKTGGESIAAGGASKNAGREAPNVRPASSRSPYLDLTGEALVRQRELLFPDGKTGIVYLVGLMDKLPSEIQSWLFEMIILILLIVSGTVFAMTYWIYLGVVAPINVLKTAARNIRDGNLDVPVKKPGSGVREMQELCQTFEGMRLKLKESQEEKLRNSRESRELISNISHDLKTPVTTIQGYVEGILDGVADTPEKREKYLHTVYHKAEDMSRLIDELTLYTRIDTNNIPYTFAKIDIAKFFQDCTDELTDELEAEGIELTFFNYLEKEERVIADAEQLRRVVNNIIGNSVKYKDKKKGIINIRLKDAGDFIHAEFEDNGKGIPGKEVTRVFDRFYRADASRNSRKGGSGIGLSIVKKIIEDHEGRVWATSKEGVGTTIYFTLRKYQDPQKEEPEVRVKPVREKKSLLGRTKN